MTNRHQESKTSGERESGSKEPKTPVEELFPNTTLRCPFWMALQTSQDRRFVHMTGAKFWVNPHDGGENAVAVYGSVHVLVDTWAEPENQVLSAYYIDARGSRWTLEPPGLKIVKQDAKTKTLVLAYADHFWFQTEWHERKTSRYHSHKTWARSADQARANARMVAVRGDRSKMNTLSSWITEITVKRVRSDAGRTLVPFDQDWSSFFPQEQVLLAD